MAGNESDEDLLTSIEGLDSDDVGNDDGDEIVEPPDDWSGVDSYGMTAREQRTERPLSQRLAEEEPDVGTRPPAEPTLPEAGATEGLDSIRTGSPGGASDTEAVEEIVRRESDTDDSYFPLPDE
ncbi:hypothetical protein C5E45_03915 [Nocardia nova]|uniref:DUF5709 domain-containing protein n=1 Tax=Nocardia nova TaxID=37330 RepID=A0A2S6AVR4_9NOCA|nr:hypothetical protein [Nocardia nova]PPJ33530.1 hypothetical protein C5E41_02835 [Nocardia nova]PPJ39321.1 hypothetical protein C5E45_03915 [Nocardia nova]